MSRRNKSKKHHSSLNPEFDAVNEAALKELKGKLELVCDECHTKYIYNIKFVDDWCNQETGKWNQLCNGRLKVVKDGKMIKLPNSVKTGKKDWKGYGGYHSGDSIVHYKSCDHPGDKVIFEHVDKKIYASNSGIKPEDNKWDLIIDLAGVAKIPSNEGFIKWGPKKYGTLSQHLKGSNIKYPEILRLDWNDMGAPPVTLKFWTRIWDLLPEKTVVCCFGGHGRTGTCIASLMIAAGLDYYTAVQTVRAEHCEKAIESLSQELYLHGIYLDMLKADLEAANEAKDEVTVAELGKDIAYAKEHRPTTKNSYGEEVKNEVKVSSNHPLDLVVSGSSSNNKFEGATYVDVDDINDTLCETKFIHGVKYVKECTRKDCNQYLCQDADHLGWVMWDQSMEQWGV